MSNLGVILLGGFAAGLMGIAFAVFLGAGWGWIVAGYVFGGQAGMLMTGALVASRAPDDDALIDDRN